MPFYIIKSFSLLFLFASFILFPQNILANSYYFQDEFNTALSPNTLDPAKWTVFPNNRPGFNTISTNGTHMITTQENYTYRYPLIISKNAIPQGDFIEEIKFQYTNYTGWGSGFDLSNKAPDNLGNYNPEFHIGVWQDTYLPKMRIYVNNNIVHSIPNNINPHVLKIELTGNTYKIYLDDNLVKTLNSTIRPSYFWMGNHTIQNTPVPNWTKFKVDYVRIQSFSPQPFLDLPWDYDKDGESFDEQALNPYSWFDHQYPLQNQPFYPPVMNYTGKTLNTFYRSHNGYDYSGKNGIKLNTPVLAAASGLATFESKENTGGLGNVIEIDHGNGYMTKYGHLQKDGLIVSQEDKSVSVTKGQQIGLVGMTGNTTGPHIHLSVYNDSNNNKTFNDDYPFGVTDPLGWEGSEPDPWSLWSSGSRTGAPSYKLFIGMTPHQTAIIPTTGGSISNGVVTAQVPPSASAQSLNLNLKNGPFEPVSETITSIVPSVYLTAFNMLGQTVNNFLAPITISYNYSGADLKNINEDSLKLYYFNLQTNLWEQLPTILDKINKIAQTQTTHLSQFGLMGTVTDSTPPITNTVLTGQKGQGDWYRSPVSVELNGQDNENGIGVLYTLYSLDGENWYEYATPLAFDQEGAYKVYYQSFDKADNIEARKTTEFNIDKTAPQITLSASPNIIWPPNGKMVDVIITGNITEDHPGSKSITVYDEYNNINPVITDFGQTIKLEAKRDGNDLDGRVYTIKATAEDLAGNISEKSTLVIVPHDQRK